MKHFDRFAGFFGCGKFHKSEASGLSREFVHHEVDGGDNTCLREIVLQVVFHRLVREITDEESRLVHANIGFFRSKNPVGRSCTCRNQLMLPIINGPSVILTPALLVLCARRHGNKPAPRVNQVRKWSFCGQELEAQGGSVTLLRSKTKILSTRWRSMSSTSKMYPWASNVSPSFGTRPSVLTTKPASVWYSP